MGPQPWLLGSLLLAATVLLAAPLVSAECKEATVGAGPLTLAQVTTNVGPGPLCETRATAYLCTARWYGGHGVLGGFVFTCEPIATVP